ncbi:hypothetical protein FHS89_000751 [Rubricella aquisinus]|uniref:Uncharacterized protein n=1 Tax=Rubricella aquisinus TaxID=2028108 RepID=A0A840WYJ5_9RHOB|nr:hypothetical protein [Rubricella aquisinus]MBB5514745.1 hypothetical protein [Rubricella aquisinus]
MLQSDIRDLRARALKHGFIAGAEALSLAHEIIDLGAERQGREEGNVVQLHCATAPNVDLT